MPAQMDYSYRTRKALPGAKADIRFDEVVTRRNEEANGVLQYGMAVQVGTTPGATVKVPVSGATAKQIDGVALRVANTEEDRTGALVVPGGVADDTASPTSDQIKLASVTPAAIGYTPAVGDYVLLTQIHGATLDIGASFGNETDDGIAIIEL